MPEHNVELGGAVAFWSLAEWSRRDLLKLGLARAGLESHTPEPRPASAALKEALEEVLGGPRVLVRPLAKRDGFVVVREDRGQEANCYSQEMRARVQANGSAPCLSFEPLDDRAVKVQEAFQRQLGLLHATQVSACLVSVVESLGGARLRPSGGIYWLPGHRVDEFRRAALAVEEAGQGKPSAVYLLRHRMDADAVRAVRDAIVGEVQTEVKRIHDEV